MKSNQLTVVKIKSLTEPGYYLDGAGLYLRITATGTKSWIFQYKLNKKSTEMGLGSLNLVSLAEARSKALDCRKLLLEGIDPKRDREDKRKRQTDEQRITFAYCAESYINIKKIDWDNAKQLSQWINTLKTYAEPVIGNLPVNLIGIDDIMRVLEPIWTTKSETANRVRQRLESVLDWATAKGYRPRGDNPARLKGNLEHLLPKVEKSKRLKHHPSLRWQDIGDFMNELRTMPGVAARALEFTILNAVRSGETRGAKWSEIQGDLWIVPKERMKARVEHHVPLSKQALLVIEQLTKSSDEIIFPGINGVMSDATLSAVIKRMKTDYRDPDGRSITVHGFRSTFRVWAAETAASSFGREAAEHALAHSLPDRVEASYQRSTLLDKRKDLMQAWADFCDINSTSSCATVTLIRGSA